MNLSTAIRAASITLLAVVPVSVFASDATPEATPHASPMATPVSDVLPALPVGMVAQLTGYGGINDTVARYGVFGTDLGHTFMVGDEMYMIFGDTFGANGSDWRSSAAAVITDDDPADGLTFDRMIEDRDGHAAELIPSKKIDFDEITVIPTYGVAVGDRLFLHYMSVEHWGDPGHWDLGSSGWAYSDDAGQTWTRDAAATWPGDSNFGQVAIEEHDGYLHIFGIPGGRFGGVHLARTEPKGLLNIDSYEYWTGDAWTTGDPAAAATIVPAPVGELSVRWNAHYNTWIMMYLNEDRAAIVLRTADEITGPWSEERVVTTGVDHPALYAPYQLPQWNDGPDIYFTMSMFGPYQVYLMKTSLPE